jgi:transposase
VTVAAGVAVAAVNPPHFRAFARTVGQLAKAGRLDAVTIARRADEVRHEPRSIPDAQAQALAGLVARRRLAALAGDAAVDRDSGSMDGHRAIARGSAEVWNVPWLAALHKLPTSPNASIRDHSA